MSSKVFYEKTSVRNKWDQLFDSGVLIDNGALIGSDVDTVLFDPDIETCIDALRNKIKNPASLTINKVIFNGPCTIVFWNDRTKTVVKKQKKDKKFDKEKAIAMAIAKKAMGNTGSYYDQIKKWLD